MKLTSNPTVAIVGAGPYGIAIAAHLKVFGIDFRIFGSPLRRWLMQMPKDMLLKSESCASNLFDPTGRYTLREYCKNTAIPYPEYGTPVSRDLFARYALSFQQKLVPSVEDITVAEIERSRGRFELRLSSGEALQAEKVIVATGMDYATYIPEQIAELPVELRSHTADYYDFGGFEGRDVTVIGGGQSALETAALLTEAGASVSLIVRNTSLVWNPVPKLARRSIYERLRSPRTRFGDGLGLWIYDNLPGLFHRLPRHIRVAKVKTTLGPAGAWWLKERVLGQLRILTGRKIARAEMRGGHVVLHLTDPSGQPAELITDYVVAGTGYRFDIDKLPFLSRTLKLKLKSERQSPQLSSNFESSVVGLYFTGLASTNAFGPAMRFLAGADYPARRISQHVTCGRKLPPPSLARSEKCREF